MNEEKKQNLLSLIIIVRRDELENGLFVRLGYNQEAQGFPIDKWGGMAKLDTYYHETLILRHEMQQEAEIVENAKHKFLDYLIEEGVLPDYKDR